MLNYRKQLRDSQVDAKGIFFLVLALVFGIEVAVMIVLPWLVSPNRPHVEAFVDSCLLTLTLSPLLWWIVVRPLRRMAELRAKLLGRVLSAQEDERRRLARELHDGIGQALTSLMVGLRRIEQSTDNESARALARDLREIGVQTHEDVRQMCRGLRPSVLDDLGLVASLERFVSDGKLLHGAGFVLDTAHLTTQRLPREVETCLYRIIQEAFSNAVKHGQARQIRVRLASGERCVALDICDDGTGFDVHRKLRVVSGAVPFGLISIEERASFLNGVATIESAVGQGTRISVRIPIQRSDANPADGPPLIGGDATDHAQGALALNPIGDSDVA